MIVIGVILGVVGLVVIFSALMSRFTESEHHKFSPAHIFFMILGPMALILSVGLIYFGLSISITNNFYRMFEEYETSMSRVSGMESKKATLELELQELLDGYVEYEGGLITALQGRDSDDLIALFEAYPALLASENVRQVTEEYVRLTEDIIAAQVGKITATRKRSGEVVISGGANQIALRYNSAAKTIPSRWFMPDDLPKKLPLFEFDGG